MNLIILLAMSFLCFGESYKVKIEGMTCGGCSAMITQKLEDQKKYSNINVDHTTGLATFETDDLVTAKELNSIIQKAGDYKVKEIVSN